MDARQIALYLNLVVFLIKENSHRQYIEAVIIKNALTLPLLFENKFDNEKKESNPYHINTVFLSTTF